MFKNVTTGSGISYTGRAWGAAWGDLNGDGLPDLWISKHNSHALVENAEDVSLYMNLGGGKFRDATAARVDYLQKDFHGAAWADFDNDGQMDIGQTAGGIRHGGVTLFEKTNGRLADATADHALDATRQTVGRNMVWFDYDDDGLLDIYLGADMVSTAGGDGGPATVLRQTAAHDFVDVRDELGLTVNNAMGPLLSDFTGDGKPELILTHYGVFSRIYDTSTVPFRNIQGKLLGDIDIPKFEDVAIADFNDDGRPDMFITRHGLEDEVTVHGKQIRAYLDKGKYKAFSFESSGDLTFTFSRQDGTMHYDQIHVGSTGYNPIDNERKPTFTLSSADAANAGIVDHSTTESGFYIGYDQAAGRWEIEMVRGSKVARGFTIDSTAAVSAVETDGFSYKPAAPQNQLLVNTGNGFIDASKWSGIADMSIYGNYAVTGDFDNDGDVDIYVVQSGQAGNRANIMLVNQGNGQFVRVQGADGAAGTSMGIGGVATAVDYDRDGFLDLLVTNGVSDPPFSPLNNDGQVQLFHNEGNSNHWVELHLHGTQSNADAIGAKVKLTIGNTVQFREAHGGQHIGGQDDPFIHFGVGTHSTIDRIVVDWPSGARSVLTDVIADEILDVIEPQASSGGSASADDLSPFADASEMNDLLMLASWNHEDAAPGTESPFDAAAGDGGGVGAAFQAEGFDVAGWDAGGSEWSGAAAVDLLLS